MTSPARDQITGEVVFPDVLLAIPDLFDGLDPQAHFNVLFSAIQETGLLTKVHGLSFLEVKAGQTHTVAVSDEDRALLFFARTSFVAEVHETSKQFSMDRPKRTSVLIEGHSPHVLSCPAGFWMYLSNPTDLPQDFVLAY